ncbi:MAG: hypothetical protein ACM3SY_11655 [Candidatus Omnitrophota bacterium]
MITNIYIGYQGGETTVIQKMSSHILYNGIRGNDILRLDIIEKIWERRRDKMVTEIKTEKLGKEETKKILAGGMFPCHCGTGDAGLCGWAIQSEIIFNQNFHKN